MGSEQASATRQAGEAGTVVVLVAAAMGAMLVMVALVLDLGGARRDREVDQLAADAMALSAATDLGGAARRADRACEAAWDYLVVNLPTAEAAPAPSCTTFVTACAPTTARAVDATIGDYLITLTHPVPDGHALLAGQPTATLDGPPCDRFGVRIQQSRANLWVAGSVELDVHAVGRLIRGVGDVTAPLVLLEATGCDVLTVNGSGTLVVTTSTGEPGYIDIDSDGSGCGSGKKIVLDVDGSGTITAGAISMWALAGDNASRAYDSTDKSLFDLDNPSISPLPTSSSAPVGRNAVDWRYNCDPSAGCPSGEAAHIDDLVADWGTGEPLPLGSFRRWTTDPATPAGCALSGDVVVPPGNWWIDCPGGLSTNGKLTFMADSSGGNIVADGPINVTGSGSLRVNCYDTIPSDPVLTCTADPPEPSILYLRSGDLVRNSDMELHETFVYLASGTINMAGNAKLTWTAPNDPTHPFDDLLLWTESTQPIDLNGTTDFKLEGVLFAPNAPIRLTGNTGGKAVGAQIFGKSLDLGGTASLTLSPSSDRMVEVGKGRAILIR